MAMNRQQMEDQIRLKMNEGMSWEQAVDHLTEAARRGRDVFRAEEKLAEEIAADVKKKAEAAKKGAELEASKLDLLKQIVADQQRRHVG
jgi:hypothetical protein